MKKSEWLDMGYKQAPTKGDDMDTVYKKFDESIWIAQFNEKHSEDQVGQVRLSMEQVKSIFGQQGV